MTIEQKEGAGTFAASVHPLSRVCDAADFFTKEYISTVKEELQGVPALNRKQWEFVQIITALKQRGLLKEDVVGLSMGSGHETVLYAIARRVKHLTVTDLYAEDSSWECARASNADEYVRKSKPFPVADERLTVLNMDMRDLSFADGSFDFAYSSCAFEHIGGDDDFIRHLREVYRVLRNGGVYIMTTEFTFNVTTIPIPNNYLFSADHLSRLIAASGFTPERTFDASLAEQSANFPIPGQIDDLSYVDENHFARTLVTSCVIPHVQLLYGRHPFTSCILVLTKDADTPPAKEMVFSGLGESRAFLEVCVGQYHDMLQKVLNLNPFSFLRGGVSPYFLPHATCTPDSTSDSAPAIFHTNYYWYGEGARRVQVALTKQSGPDQKPCMVDLRVHRFKTSNPAVVECSYHETVPILPAQEWQRELVLVTHDDHVYAVLAHLLAGRGLFSDVRVRVSPFGTDGGTAPDPARTGTLPGKTLSRRLRDIATILAPEWALNLARRARRRGAPKR
jgi:SAM-dependent methyltransferase